FVATPCLSAGALFVPYVAAVAGAHGVGDLAVLTGLEVQAEALGLEVDLAAGRFAVEVEITAQHHVDLEVHVALAEVFQFQLKALDGVPAGQVLAVAAPAEGEVFLLEAQALALELHLGVSARVDLHFVVLGDVVADDLAYVTETPLSRVAV